MLNHPEYSTTPEMPHSDPIVFPACVLTRAQTRKWGEAVDLSESVLGSLLASDEAEVSKGPLGPKVEVKDNKTLVDLEQIKLPTTREQLISTQRSDPSLERYFDLVANPEACKSKSVVLFR